MKFSAIVTIAERDQRIGALTKEMDSARTAFRTEFLVCGKSAPQSEVVTAFRIDVKQQAATLTHMCHVVLNLNEFVYPD